MAAASPVPAPFCVNRPGDTVATDRLNPAELCPWYCTKSCASGPLVANGTTAATWPADVYRTGAWAPLINTEVPATVVGTNPPLVGWNWVNWSGPKPEP